MIALAAADWARKVERQDRDAEKVSHNESMNTAGFAASFRAMELAPERCNTLAIAIETVNRQTKETAAANAGTHSSPP